MSYEVERGRYSKEHIYIVEIDLDYCSLSSGVGACSASETGNAKCYNTFASCNSLNDYNKSTKTYRFCQSRSPHPIGINAIPSLQNVSISPAKIDLSGGLGTRASVSLSFTDHPSSDINIDKYVDERFGDSLNKGTYWTKLRARNSNYENRPLRVLSGYLVDGKYDSVNFTTRYYIVDKMNVTGGMASITAKDPLKLAGSKKAQAPRASTGLLFADINDSITTAQLTPSGVGNLEYPTSGKILIGSEVMSFTRSGDVLDIGRAQNGTAASSHSANDTVQLCLEYVGKQVDFIVNDLLTNTDYANIPASFIPLSDWSNEVDDFLNGSISGIIVKPFDVFKLLKELAESMPHYLWWNEREQAIQLTALKAPPVGADVKGMDGQIIADSFKTSDKPEMRRSTIFINFGQSDPTRPLDELSNYKQTYARVDANSIAKYGSNEIQTINSRWISNTNKAAALQLAALIGRRFSDVPREVKFSMEAKDSDLWVGQTASINHRDITDFSGLPVNTDFQILTSKESKNFDYTGLEFTYGEASNEDPAAGVDLIILGSDVANINLRDEYNLLYPTPTSSTKIKVIIDSGVIIYSRRTSIYAIDTGSWPELSSGAGGKLTLQINSNAFVVGRGGDGGSYVGNKNGLPGGGAILMNTNLTLLNYNIIGAGGGGGGAGDDFLPLNLKPAGSGGAGRLAGSGGFGEVSANDGTLETGGAAVGGAGAGGNLGVSGGSGDLESGTTGGAAGVAIDKNGYTLIKAASGLIKGPELT